jgi:hypothetical protein
MEQDVSENDYNEFNGKNNLYENYPNAPQSNNIPSRNGSKQSSTPSGSLRPQQSVKRKKGFWKNEANEDEQAVSEVNENDAQYHSRNKSLKRRKASIKNTKEKKERKKPASIESICATVAFGIHDVEIPRELIESLVIRVPVIVPVEKAAKDLNKHIGKDIEANELNPSKLIDAMRRIDNLLDQNSLNEEADFVVDSPVHFSLDGVHDSNAHQELSGLDDDDDDNINSTFLLPNIFSNNYKQKTERNDSQLALPSKKIRSLLYIYNK